LTKLGEDAMRYAFEQGFRSTLRRNAKGGAISQEYRDWLVAHGKDPNKAWDDISGDLRDSFASAVYVDGDLKTKRYLNPSPQSPHGRAVVDEYLQNIHPKGKNHITVIVVSAMKYTRYLEKGTHAGKYKIRIVSAARDYIDEHYWAYVYDVYKRFEIGKPQAKVIKGSPWDFTHYQYDNESE
jgi:hypothetical protein